MCGHFMKVQTLYALTSYASTFKAPISKSCMFLLFAEQFEASLTNSVDADQTAPVGSVQSGSTLFVSIFMLNNNQTLFCWRFEV